jgi:hypothetical protein
MTRCRLFFCVTLGVLLSTGWLAGQDEKKDPAKLKGQLPANWGKLGLSKEQIQKAYAIQAEFKGKMDGLNAQLAKLKTQQQAELEKVLTPTQKEKLREIITGKAPAEDPPKKKPSDK